MENDEKELSIEKLEALDYYSFMAYLKVPSFVIGGLESTMELAKRTNITKDSKVLIVGCGTGATAVHFTKKLECTVIGIDISELMINMAIYRAEMENISKKCEFRIGDAHNLEFSDNTFDAVICEFVAQFLDVEVAFKEFLRVLKPNGYLGINEMTKENEIPDESSQLITKAENIFRDLTDYPFTIHSISHWQDIFEKMGFNEINCELFHKIMGGASAKAMIKDMGGWGKLFGTLGKLLKYYRKSEKLKNKFKLISKAKNSLLRNKKVKPYVGYALCVGKKG